MRRLASLFGKREEKKPRRTPKKKAKRPAERRVKNPARKQIDASNRAALRQYRADYEDSIVKTVTILATPNSCPACKSVAGKRYHPFRVPKLPVKDCTHPLGCRCCYSAVVD